VPILKNADDADCDWDTDFNEHRYA
jgi:hypothetical protein